MRENLVVVDALPPVSVQPDRGVRVLGHAGTQVCPTTTTPGRGTTYSVKRIGDNSFKWLTAREVLWDSLVGSSRYPDYRVVRPHEGAAKGLLGRYHL